MCCISTDSRWSLNHTFLCLGSSISSSLVFSGVCVSGGREITLFTHTLSKSKLSSSLSAGSRGLKRNQLKTKHWDAKCGNKIWRIFTGQSGKWISLAWKSALLCPYISINDYIPVTLKTRYCDITLSTLSTCHSKRWWYNHQNFLWGQNYIR